jgi:hypothetical protein
VQFEKNAGGLPLFKLNLHVKLLEN